MDEEDTIFQSFKHYLIHLIRELLEGQKIYREKERKRAAHNITPTTSRPESPNMRPGSGRGNVKNIPQRLMMTA